MELSFGGNLAFFATEGKAVLPYLADVSLAELCQVIPGFNLVKGACEENSVNRVFYDGQWISSWQSIRVHY